MANYNIETGYKPEFALGALYAGENAANQETMAQQDLIKMYLANQRETSMQPLDVDIKSRDAAQARQLNTPDLLQRFAAGKGGEWDSQSAKGKVDTALVPSNIFSGKAKSMKEGTENDLYHSLNAATQALTTGLDTDGNPLTPEAMGQLKGHRDQLVTYLSQDPKHAQKMAEIGLQGENALAVANVNASASQANARTAADAKTSTEKLNEQMAGHLDVIADNTGKYSAADKARSGEWLKRYEAIKLASNPGAYTQRPNIPGLPYAPSPVQQQGGGQGQSPPAPAKGITQAEFDSQWAKLSKGQSLTGPNGITYTKQ